MTKNISPNKHEYNVRRVDELNEVILEKEKALKDITGFINLIKAKHEIKKLYKQLYIHGSEVLEFETKESTLHTH